MKKSSQKNKNKKRKESTDHQPSQVEEEVHVPNYTPMREYPQKLFLKKIHIYDENSEKTLKVMKKRLFFAIELKTFSTEEFESKNGANSFKGGDSQNLNHHSKNIFKFTKRLQNCSQDIIPLFALQRLISRSLNLDSLVLQAKEWESLKTLKNKNSITILKGNLSQEYLNSNSSRILSFMRRFTAQFLSLQCMQIPNLMVQQTTYNFYNMQNLETFYLSELIQKVKNIKKGVWLIQAQNTLEQVNLQRQQFNSELINKFLDHETLNQLTITIIGGTPNFYQDDIRKLQRIFRENKIQANFEFSFSNYNEEQYQVLEPITTIKQFVLESPKSQNICIIHKRQKLLLPPQCYQLFVLRLECALSINSKDWKDILQVLKISQNIRDLKLAINYKSLRFTVVTESFIRTLGEVLREKDYLEEIYFQFGNIEMNTSTERSKRSQLNPFLDIIDEKEYLRKITLILPDKNFFLQTESLRLLEQVQETPQLDYLYLKINCQNIKRQNDVKEAIRIVKSDDFQDSTRFKLEISGLEKQGEIMNQNYQKALQNPKFKFNRSITQISSVRQDFKDYLYLLE